MSRSQSLQCIAQVLGTDTDSTVLFEHCRAGNKAVIEVAEDGEALPNIFGAVAASRERKRGKYWTERIGCAFEVRDELFSGNVKARIRPREGQYVCAGHAEHFQH